MRSVRSPGAQGVGVDAVEAGHNAQVVLEQAWRLTEQVHSALTSRAVIDQAVGILMSRDSGTSSEALASLRGMSQSANVTLNVVAQHLVDETHANFPNQ